MRNGKLIGLFAIVAFCLVFVSTMSAAPKSVAQAYSGVPSVSAGENAAVLTAGTFPEPGSLATMLFGVGAIVISRLRVRRSR